MDSRQFQALKRNITYLRNLTVDISSNEVREILEGMTLDESNRQMMFVVQSLIDDTLQSFLHITDNLKDILALTYRQSELLAKAKQEGE